MEDKKVVIECDCGAHLLVVNSTIDKIDDVHISQDITLAMFTWGSDRPGFWHRLQMAWRVIWKGDPYEDQLVMSPAEAAKLADFINENLITR